MWWGSHLVDTQLTSEYVIPHLVGNWLARGETGFLSCSELIGMQEGRGSHRVDN